ncbi:MAG: PAS domain-containing protein, partial [Calditrichia bacterium]|nr:PAS domain-containing protein [Calditrichia bacterium]
MEKGSNFFEWTHKRLGGKSFPATVLLTRVKIKDKTFLQATVRDISTHKEEHEKLILFKNAVESSFDAIGMATPEGKHWYQNKAFDELFGEVGDNPPETAYVYPKVGHEIFKTIMGGAHWTGEVEIYGKNKQILNIFLRAYSIKDNNGKVIGLVGAHTNITKQKEAEKALQQSKERFRLLANNLPSVMIYQAIVKPDGSREFSYVSENIKYINEVPAEAVLADPNVLYGQVLPEHLPYLIKNENIALKNMATFRHEIKLRLPSGKIRWFQLVSTPHKMPNGNVAWDGVQIDITDQKNVLEALQKQQDFTTNILEGTNAGIWEWNIATGVVTINKRWAEIFGYTIEELSPLSTNTLRENIHPDDLETTNSILQQHIEGKLEYYDAVFRQPHKDGGWIWVNSRGKIVERDEKGKPLRMSGTHIDITERKLV